MCRYISILCSQFDRNLGESSPPHHVSLEDTCATLIVLFSRHGLYSRRFAIPQNLNYQSPFEVLAEKDENKMNDVVGSRFSRFPNRSCTVRIMFTDFFWVVWILFLFSYLLSIVFSCSEIKAGMLQEALCVVDKNYQSAVQTLLELSRKLHLSSRLNLQIQHSLDRVVLSIILGIS